MSQKIFDVLLKCKYYTSGDMQNYCAFLPIKVEVALLTSIDYIHFPFLNRDLIIHPRILELVYFSFLLFFPSDETIVHHHPSKRDVTRNGFYNQAKIIKTAEGIP